MNKHVWRPEAEQEPEALEQRISAAMDGECSAAEGQSTIDAMLGDKDSCQRWQRYHAIRAVMRNDAAGFEDVDLSASVMAALESEPVVLAPGNLRRRNWLQPVISMAAAASVTVAVVWGWQHYGFSAGGSSSPAQLAVAQPKPAPVQPVVVAAATKNTASTKADPAMTDDERVRLQSYMTAHVSSGAPMQPGFVSYVRLVSEEQGAR